MKSTVLLSAVIVAIVILPRDLAGKTVGESSAQEGCDQEVLEVSKGEFKRMTRIYQKNPDDASREQLRSASREYIWESEACYQSEYGVSPFSGQKIDDGGMWANSGGPGIAPMGSDRFNPQHDLLGTKWGADSPFAGGADATGPRSFGSGSGPSGEVTYSYMASGILIGDDCLGGCSCGAGCINTSIFSLAFTDSGGDTEQARCLQREVGDAFAAWSAVSDIQFRPAVDSGAPFDSPAALGDIRIGFHLFDGASGTLAHGYSPPPNGFSAAGDIHFDTSEAWTCSNTSGSIDFGMVALHEIGHAIGLGHETGGDLAVMNPFYNPALWSIGPLADDIIGAGEIYGGAGAAKTSFFGPVGIGTDSPSELLHLVDSSLELKMRLEQGTPGTNAWAYSVVNSNAAAPNAFRISKQGSGGPEVEFHLRLDGEAGGACAGGNCPTMEVFGSLRATNVTFSSSRDLKTEIEPVNGKEILRRVAELPISQWRFKTEVATSRHIGPMAEDFNEAFDLAGNAKTISVLDSTGLAMAAIKGLYKEAQERDERIAELANQVAKLQQIVHELAAKRNPDDR